MMVADVVDELLMLGADAPSLWRFLSAGEDREQVVAASTFKPGAATILVGPEGGFTDEERAAIRAVPTAVPISLGPRILRAETAALAALTAYMAVAGDWR